MTKQDIEVRKKLKEEEKPKEPSTLPSLPLAFISFVFKHPLGLSVSAPAELPLGVLASQPNTSCCLWGEVNYVGPLFWSLCY